MTFSSNFEASASELQENREEMFLRYWLSCHDEMTAYVLEKKSSGKLRVDVTLCL